MESIIGYVAAVLTTTAFFPQAIKVIRTKATRDISLVGYAMFTFGIGLWLIYGLLRSDWPVILSNAITLVPSATILAMKLRYR